MPLPAVLPAILLKSVLLAAAAGWAAHRFNRISLPILLTVVLFYQVAGTLGEWAMVGSFFQAVQDFRIGLPGMAYIRTKVSVMINQMVISAATTRFNMYRIIRSLL